MSRSEPAPRLEIDLAKIQQNASTLVGRLGRCGIGVTGVTKATLGSSEIAAVLLSAGVNGLGDARIENIAAMRCARVPGSMTLIRSPMLSQARQVVMQANISCNTEIEVIGRLSFEARRANRLHGVILMVELGDLREGIMPEELHEVVRKTCELPNIEFKGIGTNLACRSGVSPDHVNMARLSQLAEDLEKFQKVKVEIVSGGNSANLNWALSGADTGRINDLRLGESILLGCETLHRQPIEGLFLDAITLVAEVIETKVKPSLATGKIAQSAFGAAPRAKERGRVRQSLLAIGRQDIDPDGLLPPVGMEIMAASSDHLILESPDYPLSVGTEVRFGLNYSALVRAMTSPFVTRVMRGAAR